VITSDEIETLVRRTTQLAADRQPHEVTWRECFDYSFPERGAGLTGDVSNLASDVQTKKARMLDGTGRDALQTLCAGLMGGVTPANQQWFELDAGRENEVEKLWLSEASRLVWENIHNSNFDAEAMDCMADAGAAGWFVLYVDEAEGGGYQFESWPIAECFPAQSRKAGGIDILHRRYKCSVENLVVEFGFEGVSEDVRNRWSTDKLGDMIEVVRVIEPRRNSNGILARNMPYRSVTIECQTKHVLRESGYHEFPCVAARWNRLPGSVYATGPFLNALADVKTLNALVANELAATDLAVGGLWVGKADGVLNPKTVKIGPRKIISVADTDNLKPLLTGSDFNVAWTEKQSLQAQIRRTLMADQLEPQDKNGMTAYEVHVRVQMIRQMLGPVFGRFQAEYLQPLIARCFGIAYRAGVLGDPPESLAERAYTVRYRSPLARAQKLEDVTAIEATLAATGQLAQAKQDPDVWDTIDLDAAIKEVAEGRGVPVRLIRKAEDIQQMRDDRAAQRKQMQEDAMQQEAQLAATKQMTGA
jgi:hypothetical protein